LLYTLELALDTSKLVAALTRYVIIKKTGAREEANDQQ
tara:strand:+ start:1210 stop:1323 length:114 start_codon:yes stop_codon:yes gene_type:complete